ncbi:MAG TPA: TetR/AcrR family transcriptional regulator [Desulfobacteria bacterium]|nr:TetR/AcrR family transcriptional regulator [Desulfobacteria bacterium]
MAYLDTSDRILDASIVLFSQKGYSEVTTKEIAKEAGVCEMTLFRHFENKRNLFAQAVEKFVFLPAIKPLFEEYLEWDLEKDLAKISLTYQETLKNNHKIIWMEIKNEEFSTDPDGPLFKFPRELKRLLVNYLEKMKERGVVKEDPHTLAVMFLTTNFGYFMTTLLNHELTKSFDVNSWVATYTKLLCKAAML